MALTDIQIANKALLRVGVNRQIAALTDGSAESAAVNVLLADLKTQVLGSHRWSWAMRQAALVERTLDAIPRGWEYAYDQPSDLLTPVEIWSGDRQQAPAGRVPFELGVGAATVGETATSYPVVLTDEADAELVYVSSTWTAALVPALVDDALAWMLAAELVMPLSIKPDVAAQGAKMAELALERASAHDANGRQLGPEPAPSFITARY